MIDINIIINQMIIFSFLLFIGFIAYKIKFLDDVSLKGISVFILKISLPCLIITMIPGSLTREDLSSSYIYFLIAIIIYIILFIFSYLCGKIFSLKGKTFNIHIAQGTFGNSGFLGIPLVLSLLGNEGIYYLSLYTFIDKIFTWTFAYYLASGSKNLKGNLKNLINPAIIALFIAVIMIIFDIHIPSLINEPLSLVGDTTKSISVVYIGGLLGSIKLGKVFKNKSVYSIVALKMIIAPIIVYWILNTFFTIPISAMLTFVIITSLPSITITSIFAKNNDSDYEYALSTIFITTLFSICTIPLVFYIISLI